MQQQLDVAQAELKALEGGPACFSPDRHYRYTLTRVWDGSLGTVAWICLNPSTADERRLDPTLRRVLRFTHGWGYGGFTVLNLFAIRSKDPLFMKAHPEPVGPENDRYIKQVTKGAQLVVAGWGTHGVYRNRATEVLAMLRKEGIPVHSLKNTSGGQPCHPLYLSSELTPKPYS
jgi:hypothetical protein